MFAAMGFGGGEKEAPKEGEPTSTTMRSVKLNKTFEKMSLEETFNLMFGKDIVIRYQAAQGNKDVEVSDWKDVSTAEDKTAGVLRQQRTLKYTIPINVTLPKMMADSMGMVDTVAVNTETATLKDGVYEVTATCELSGPPMCNKVDVKPIYHVKADPKDAASSVVDLDVQFSFNVWGLASMVESTMESGVQKGFSDLLELAGTMAKEAKA